MPRKPLEYNLKYSPMGDSLTQGFYATTTANRFVQKVCDLFLSNKGIVMTPDGSGIPGGTLANGMTAIDLVNSKLPDLVTIEYGTNDCNAQNNVPIATFESQLNQLIDAIAVNVGRNPKLCLVTTWNQGVLGDPFDAVIKKVGQERGIPVADIKSIYLDATNKGPAGVSTPNGSSDNWHPNDKGMNLISQTIYNQIASLLTNKANRIAVSNRELSSSRQAVSDRVAVE